MSLPGTAGAALSGKMCIDVAGGDKSCVGDANSDVIAVDAVSDAAAAAAPTAAAAAPAAVAAAVE